MVSEPSHRHSSYLPFPYFSKGWNFSPFPLESFCASRSPSRAAASSAALQRPLGEDPCTPPQTTAGPRTAGESRSQRYSRPQSLRSTARSCMKFPPLPARPQNAIFVNNARATCRGRRSEAPPPEHPYTLVGLQVAADISARERAPLRPAEAILQPNVAFHPRRV